MRGLLFVILSFGITILAWGLYGPFLHVGQAAMSETDAMARMRPFVCVGIAYFAIGVVVPLLLLYTKEGERELDFTRYNHEPFCRRAWSNWGVGDHPLF